MEDNNCKKSGSFRSQKVYFTQVSNNILRDKTINLKVKGLYALIQSYLSIENFTLYKSTLQKACSEGEVSFENTWRLLKESGYLIQYKLNNQDGKFYYEYELIDSLPVDKTL